MELTLLGTGTPQPSPQRAGPSNHLRIGGESVLVDTGTGCVRRMVEVGQDTAELDYIFLTHMHSDHTIDLAHVLLTGWIRYRKRPFTVIGPARRGTSSNGSSTPSRRTSASADSTTAWARTS